MAPGRSSWSRSSPQRHRREEGHDPPPLDGADGPGIQIQRQPGVTLSPFEQVCALRRLFNALIGFAVVILCKIIAGLVGGALGAPGGGAGAAGITLRSVAWALGLLG